MVYPVTLPVMYEFEGKIDEDRFILYYNIFLYYVLIYIMVVPVRYEWEGKIEEDSELLLVGQNH